MKKKSEYAIYFNSSATKDELLSQFKKIHCKKHANRKQKMVKYHLKCFRLYDRELPSRTLDSQSWQI